MGKHSAEGGEPRRVVTVVGVVLGLVLAVGGAATGWALLQDRANGTRATGQATGTASTGSASTSSSPSSPGSSTPSTEDAARAAVQQALTACAAEVYAGEAVAAKAAVSAAHWSTHTGAQLKFDSGEFTLAQTKAAWAASKATGPQDVAQFRAAEQAYHARDGKCGAVKATAAETDLADHAASCAARGAALAHVAATGAVVNDQWAAHLDMMAHKDHFVTATYRAKWEGMVRAAQPALAAYRGAVDTLSHAPACSTA